MKYIGIDLHAKTFSINVQAQDGTTLWADTCPTSGSELISRIIALSGPKTVVFEESTVADWAFRLLSPHAKVIVADPRQNRHIAADQMIDDATSARKLVELVRAGSIKPVHHSDSDERQQFKELVQAYHDQTRELTRCKNKIKAKFRGRAIDCTGSSVFNAAPDNRERWLAQLPTGGTRVHVRILWERLDLLEAQKRTLLSAIRQLAAQFPEVERFMQLPGIGLIRAVTFFAVIDTPHRFPTKGKLWGYCGLGIAGRKSASIIGPEHLTRFGNRTLKNALKGAALTAIQIGGNLFADRYQQKIADGMSAELARVNVARSIANTMWAMWRRGEEYQPDRANPWDNTA